MNMENKYIYATSILKLEVKKYFENTEINSYNDANKKNIIKRKK